MGIHQWGRQLVYLNEKKEEAERNYTSEMNAWHVTNNALITLWRLGVYGEHIQIAWTEWRKRK